MKIDKNLFIKELYKEGNTLEDLRQLHFQWLISVGFVDKNTPLEHVALLHEECAEIGRELREYIVDDNKVGVELADLILRCLGFASEFNLDIESFIKEKMEINLNKGNKGRIK